MGKLSRLVLVVGFIVMVYVLIVGAITFISRDPIRWSFAAVGVAAAIIVIIAAGPWFKEGLVFQSKPGIWALRFGGAFAMMIIGLVIAGGVVRYVGPGTDAPPDSITDPLTQSIEVLKYANGLTYDSTHHESDQQWLEVKDKASRSVSLGPLAWIRPEHNSFRNNRTDLYGIGRGQGRIVAMIWVDPGYDSGRGHHKLGLPADTSWLWIDNISDKTDSVRAIIFSRKQAPVVLKGATYGTYPGKFAGYPQGRWAFDPKDPCMCESCELHGWCMVCGSGT